MAPVPFMKEGEAGPLEVGDAGVELARAAVAGGLRAEAGLRGEGGGHLHEPEPAVVVVVRLSGVERLIRLRASTCEDRLVSIDGEVFCVMSREGRNGVYPR